MTTSLPHDEIPPSCPVGNGWGFCEAGNAGHDGAHVFPKAAPAPGADKHGNLQAQEGCDRCGCGAKYWENDRCVSCGEAFQPVLRACNACNAEAGETCNVGCIGEAAELESAYGVSELCPVCGQPDNCGDCTHEEEGSLESIRRAEQEGREAAVQAAVVIRTQLLSNPLLAPHLAAALETLVSYAESELVDA